MTLIELLRKLGILRYGTTAAVYEGGAERPTELMMDGLYDANKELAGGERADPNDPHQKR